MSEEKIPWDRVAKEIIKTLGVETARGLYYALISQTLYPMIANAIAQRTRGGRVSEEAVSYTHLTLPTTERV